MSELRGNTALDSSALIEYLTGTAIGNVLREYFRTLTPDETVSSSLFALSETFYVLCRLKGPEFAREKTRDILASRVVGVSNSTEFALQTGRLKCERAISLSDCSCLATARLNKAKAVFAFREKELLREMRKKSFDVDVVFLEDVAARNARRGASSTAGAASSGTTPT